MADNSHQSAADAAAEAAQSAGDPYGHLIQQQPDQLQMFWTSQREEMEQINDFKSHKLPIGRIKKIMKSDRDVRMISGEAPVLFAKACELFIQELTLRAWLQAQEYKRRTLKKADFIDAIRQTEIFDFLVDVVSRDETEEEATVIWPGMVGSTVSGVPYCYPPMGQPAPPMGQPAPPMGQPAPSMGQPAPSGVMMRRHAMPWVAPSMYVQPSLQSLMPAAEDNPSATGGGTVDRVTCDSQSSGSCLLDHVCC